MSDLPDRLRDLALGRFPEMRSALLEAADRIEALEAEMAELMVVRELFESWRRLGLFSDDE